MKQSTNYKIDLPEGNNIVDVSVLNNNVINLIDKGLVLDIGTSTGTGNDYILNLGSITLTSANKGISFKFWADKNSTGAVTINGTYNLVDSNLKPVKNVKAGVPYTVIYDGGTNFFLASSGTVDYASTSVGTDGSKVLAPSTFIGEDGEIHTGTMVNRGAPTASLNCGGTYNISEGYYSGGKVTANSLASQTSATATATKILKGYTAWVNGSKITGTATIKSLTGIDKKTTTITSSVSNKLSYSGRCVYLTVDNPITEGTVIFVTGIIKTTEASFTQTYNLNVWMFMGGTCGYVDGTGGAIQTCNPGVSKFYITAGVSTVKKIDHADITYTVYNLL